MIRTTVHVSGMVCGMCEAHIADTVRRAVPDAKKVKASRRKGTAVFVTEAEPDRGRLEAAIAETGYRLLGVTGERIG